MKISNYLFIAFLSLIITSCGPKETLKVCAGGVRKEFKDGPVYATIEDGCVIKYDAANEYKATGSVNLKVTESPADVTIHLTKGKLQTMGGDFIIKDDKTGLKIRLISGHGKVNLGEKSVELEVNKVLEMK